MNTFSIASENTNVKQGVESIAFQAALIHLLREEMFQETLHE